MNILKQLLFIYIVSFFVPCINAATIPPLTFKEIEAMRVKDAEKNHLIKGLCNKLRSSFKHYKWPMDKCETLTQWQVDWKSFLGDPLIYTKIGDGPLTTLILGGVHPDELTPVPLAFEIIQFLTENPETIQDSRSSVIIAPLVNPDGFFLKKPTRTNHRGVDLNRNFPTKDWYSDALPSWKKKKHRAQRYFPGFYPNSEIETIFQIALIEKFKPDKILSIHAPLGFLDYDGPGDQKRIKRKSPPSHPKQLVYSISEKSRNYGVVDYSFFPGSLGNFAGQERGIPTITLELKTTKPEKYKILWELFRPGITEALNFESINSEHFKQTGSYPQHSFFHAY